MIVSGMIVRVSTCELRSDGDGGVGSICVLVFVGDTEVEPNEGYVGLPPGTQAASTSKMSVMITSTQAKLVLWSKRLAVLVGICDFFILETFAFFEHKLSVTYRLKTMVDDIEFHFCAQALAIFVVLICWGINPGIIITD